VDVSFSPILFQPPGFLTNKDVRARKGALSVEITLTYHLPDFRPDVAAFAQEHNLTVYYGEYFFEGESEEEHEYAMLVSVGHLDWEERADSEELQEKFIDLVGEDEIDRYSGEEYWAGFYDQETLVSCIEQFGQQIRQIFPDVRFETTVFEE
jgi:hypothetical protein